jgi:universal stress protein A
MFTDILVPTDFSEPSEAALDYALALAATHGSRLHLLHVVDASFVTGPVSAEIFVVETPAEQAALFDDAKAKLAHRAARCTSGKITTEVITGTSARTIICYARARSIDLIVMGTHGRSGMAHLFMGSVAEKVVRDAPCPVLTVRQAPSGLRQAEFLDPIPHLVAVDAQ